MSGGANRPMRIGLTGGIATGKSTVADMFAARGVPVIDSDLIAREIVAPGTPALAEIEGAFGDGILDAAGALDRGRMREIIFSDEAQRRRLENILHPRIRAAMLERAAASEAAYLVFVVPLLVETGFDREVDRVLVVDCDEAEQLRRLGGRDGETPDQARQMLAAQAGRSERLAAADDVIDNSGDLDATGRQVEALHRRYSAGLPAPG